MNSGLGWLNNGNPPGDFRKAPRCGAKTRGARGGRPCLAPAMANGRCRMHGGNSTGPITEEGKRQSRGATLKHGVYSKFNWQTSIIISEDDAKFAQLMRNYYGKVDDSTIVRFKKLVSLKQIKFLIKRLKGENNEH